MADSDDPITDAVVLDAPAPDPVTQDPPTTLRETPKPPPPKPEPRRNGFFGFVLGGVVAAGIGFALAQFVPAGWPVADTTALATALKAEVAETQGLKAQVAELVAAPKARQADPGLAARMDAMESSLAAINPQAITDRLTALEDRLTKIEALPPDGSAASGAALAALQADVAAMKAGGPSVDSIQKAKAAIDDQVKAAEDRLAALQSAAKGLTRASAMQQISAALDSGAPFAAALAQLDGDLPKSLTDTAKSGVPSLQSLRSSFPEAARAALDAALKANMGGSWTDRVSAFLANQTGARSLTPRDGTDPDAVLSRAEAALTAGDLAKVLVELSGLPPEGQTAMAAWIADCKSREQAQGDLAALLAATGG